LHLDAKLTRAEFQKMTSDLLDRCKAPFKQVIADAGIKLAEIHHVVLVGGATRMPAVVGPGQGTDRRQGAQQGREPGRGRRGRRLPAGRRAQGRLRHDEIVANWERARRNEPLLAIPPLP